jgi:hypothetical protein
MSWFKRKPAPKAPKHTVTHCTSPTTERLLKKTKEETKPSRQPPAKEQK